MDIDIFLNGLMAILKLIAKVFSASATQGKLNLWA